MPQASVRETTIVAWQVVDTRRTQHTDRNTMMQCLQLVCGAICRLTARRQLPIQAPCLFPLKRRGHAGPHVWHEHDHRLHAGTTPSSSSSSLLTHITHLCKLVPECKPHFTLLHTPVTSPSGMLRVYPSTTVTVSVTKQSYCS